MYFNLTTQQLTGEGSEKIIEVRWSGDTCFVNNRPFPVKEATVRGADVMHVKKKIQEIRENSSANLFIVLSDSTPFFINNGYQTRLVYSEANI